MPSKQEVMNRISEVFFEQGYGPCFDDELGSCLYRRGDGHPGCAIGCVLPDELFDERINSLSISEIIIGQSEELQTVRKKITSYLFQGEDVDSYSLRFFEMTQEAHDRPILDCREHFHSLFAQNLASICRQYSLTLPDAIKDQLENAHLS